MADTQYKYNINCILIKHIIAVDKNIWVSVNLSGENMLNRDKYACWLVTS
jgi:hypothetical protein